MVDRSGRRVVAERDVIMCKRTSANAEHHRERRNILFHHASISKFIDILGFSTLAIMVSKICSRQTCCIPCEHCSSGKTRLRVLRFFLNLDILDPMNNPLSKLYIP